MPNARPQHQAPRPVRRVRGVSLVEALVALAVMSFGMLGVVGVQATLRFNAEVSKQRSEAVRIGQEEMESLRSFVQLPKDPANERHAYEDITADTAGRSVTDYKSNTSYMVTREVAGLDEDPFKRITVKVSWPDRNGVTTEIVLASSIARLDPALTAGLLRKETITQAHARPLDRQVAIPTAALNLGDGYSAIKPPGTEGASYALVFDNSTGLVVSVCPVSADISTSSLSAALLSACGYKTASGAPYHVLSGFIRFSTGAAPDAANPNSAALNLDVRLSLTDARTATCYDDAPDKVTDVAGRTFVNYLCLIPANAERKWAGSSTLAPVKFSDTEDAVWSLRTRAASASTHRLCRFTPATSDLQWVPNDQHPLKYGFDRKGNLQTEAMAPVLSDQNFLIINASADCPTDGAPNPVAGKFVSYNTLEHLP